MEVLPPVNEKLKNVLVLLFQIRENIYRCNVKRVYSYKMK